MTCHILLWEGALLAQKLQNHSRCRFMIMLTPLVSIRYTEYCCENGPAGPDVMEPLELLVLDRSDPAGQNTDVEMGPAGPEITEPLELLVLDRADPAGQHAVIRDTTRWLERPREWMLPTRRTGEKDFGRGAGDTSGAGYYPGHSTYGGDSLPGASSSGGGGGPWTVDPWRGLCIWKHWSSRFFINGGLCNVINVL